MSAVLPRDNSTHLEEFALSSCILIDEESKPENEPDDFDDFARGLVANQGVETVAAFEVALAIRNHFKKRVRLPTGPHRLISAQNIYDISRHAMRSLKVAFSVYRAELTTLNKERMRVLSCQIAGLFQVDPTINLLTGSGIQFTGLCKLYYDQARLNRVEAAKHMLGISTDGAKPMYSVKSYPSLQDIEKVVKEAISYL